MDFDFKGILNFAFVDWFKQKGIWKYVAFLFIFYFLTNLVSSYAMYALFSPLWNISSMGTGEAINLIFYFIGFVIAMVLFSIIVGSIVSYFIIAKALDSKKMDFVEFNFGRVLKFIGLMIAENLAVLFSIFKLRLLLILIAAVALTMAGLILVVLAYNGATLLAIVGLSLLLIALLLYMAYFVVMVYNSLRLTLSSAIFVESEKGIMDSLRSSWNISRGNVLNILVVLLIMGLVLGIVSWIASMPLSMYLTAMSPVNMTTGEVSFSQSLSQLLNPIAILLTIPSIFVQSIFIIIQTFGMIAIYFELKNKKEAKAPIEEKVSSAKKEVVSKRVASKKVQAKKKKK
ncbi:MAG: hypothetical protein WC821_01625 [archaeon]|jgi:hypothetical protein